MESLVGVSGRCLALGSLPDTRNLPTRRWGSRNSQLVPVKVQTRASKSLRQSRGEEGIKSVKAFAALQTVDSKTGPIAELKPGQVQEFHVLPSGLRLEFIVQSGGRSNDDAKRKRTPLVFIHGSMHAAWCWTFHWMPFFSARGYDCYAISFLGQGASDVPQASVAGTLDSHSKDIGHFIRSKFSTPPVLIAHSFGGLVSQYYLSKITNPAPEGRTEDLYPRPAGVVLACSTPPTGNGPMVMRFLKKDLGASIKITLGFAAKLIATSLSMCRDCLFSQDFPEDKLKHYMTLLKRSSRMPILDLRAVSQTLPVPRPSGDVPPVLVLHAENDYLVDAEGSEETAEWWCTKPVLVPECAHDLMLDTQWEAAARIVNSWLEENAV